ncbi:hypothetical protein [Mesorhizobium sp.]|uniref:hypothetical protein n=1 Tax=Mesorhizobium sp. TaxID=1871066 RepID=UPI00257FD1A4|nr:hypothetical protein [Mesorhizobium sp.]
MSGGVGSLWPLSPEDDSKELHDFSGDGSMLAKGLRRRPHGETPDFVLRAAARGFSGLHQVIGERTQRTPKA